HHAKLQAFLDWLEAPPALRALHAVWNGAAADPLPALQEAGDAACVQAALGRLSRQDDLATKLLRFVAQRS
ncbi:MAG: DUF2331 family protein, partial [Comamonadaceae bacterium]